MSNVGSVMIQLAFASVLVVGGVSVGCVSNDVDPESGGSASGGSGNASAGSPASGGSATAGSSAASAGSATGGSTTGAPACATVAKASGKSPVITDFESMTVATGTYTFDDGALIGGTYIYTDPMSTPASTSKLSFAAGHDDASKQALLGSISNPTWGGGMGLWFSCEDASTFTGITFWARGASPAGPIKLNLTVNDVEVTSKGGLCPDAGPCVRPSVTFDVTDEWQEFTFAWGDFTPGDAAGTPVPGGGDNLYGLDFGLTNDNMARELELAVDDFAFTTE